MTRKKTWKKDTAIYKLHRCCFCRQLYQGLGNSAAPLKENGRCCNGCNYTRVLPARVSLRFHLGSRNGIERTILDSEAKVVRDAEI